MSWKTVLSDKAKFGDDKEIMFEGVKLTLGELRQLNTASEGELAKKLDDVKSQQTQLDAQSAAVKQQQAEAATFYQQLLDEKAKQPVAPTNKEGFDFFTDPAWAPIAQPIKKQLDEALTLKQQLAQIQKAVLDVATIYTRDKWHSTYQQLPDLKDATTGKERYSLEDLVKKANAERLVDPISQIADIRAAYERLEEPRRLEALKQKSYAEGLEKGKAEAAMANQSRPFDSSFAPAAGLQNGGTNGKALNFEEAYQAALRDPDIMASLNAGL